MPCPRRKENEKERENINKKKKKKKDRRLENPTKYLLKTQASNGNDTYRWNKEKKEETRVR